MTKRCCFPWGAILATAVYGVFAYFIHFHNWSGQDEESTACAGEDACRTEGVDNSVLNWASDFYLASWCLLLGANHYKYGPRVSKQGFTCLVFMGIGYLTRGITSKEFSNNGRGDGKGMIGYFIFWPISYFFLTISIYMFSSYTRNMWHLLEPHHRAKRMCEVISSETFVILSFMVITTGSIWCIFTDGITVDGEVDDHPNDPETSDPPSVQMITYGTLIWSFGQVIFWASTASVQLEMVQGKFPVYVFGMSNSMAAICIIVFQLSTGMFWLLLQVVESQNGLGHFDRAYWTVIFHYGMVMTAFFIHNLMTTMEVGGKKKQKQSYIEENPTDLENGSESGRADRSVPVDDGHDAVHSMKEDQSETTEESMCNDVVPNFSFTVNIPLNAARKAAPSESSLLESGSDTGDETGDDEFTVNTPLNAARKAAPSESSLLESGSDTGDETGYDEASSDLSVTTVVDTLDTRTRDQHIKFCLAEGDKWVYDDVNLAVCVEGLSAQWQCQNEDPLTAHWQWQNEDPDAEVPESPVERVFRLGTTYIEEKVSKIDERWNQRNKKDNKDGNATTTQDKKTDEEGKSESEPSVAIVDLFMPRVTNAFSTPAFPSSASEWMESSKSVLDMISLKKTSCADDNTISDQVTEHTFDELNSHNKSVSREGSNCIGGPVDPDDSIDTQDLSRSLVGIEQTTQENKSVRNTLSTDGWII